MPPKREKSTGMSRNVETAPAKSTDSKSISSSKKSSLKSADTSQPSTSTKSSTKAAPKASPRVTRETSSISTMRSENYANRSKSIRQADNMERAKTAFLTMQMVDSQRRDLFLQVTLRDIFFYFIFLICLSFMVLGQFNSSMYYLTRTLTEKFITKQYNNKENIPVTFNDIMKAEDILTYCDEVLTKIFYKNMETGDSTNSTNNASSALYLTKENRLIGLPRFRQVRVKPSSCILGYKFKSMNCFGEFSPTTENTQQIYDNDHGEIKKWKYFSQDKLEGLNFQGKMSTYNGAGFIQHLGNSAKQTKEICGNMRKYVWIKRDTRCMFFDFVVYNVNLNLFCVVKLIFEFPLTGGVIPYYSFTTVKLIRYVTIWDYRVKAAEWLCIAFLIFYTLEEMREVWYFRVLYLFQFWNYMDIAIIILGYACIGYAVTISYEVVDTFNKYLHLTSAYANFEYVAKMQKELNNMFAILLFLAYIKIFKYLSFNKTFGQLNNTLLRCALDILAFSIMFFIVFIGYSELGYFLFGSQIDGFRTVGSAIITLLRTILGDFDYTLLKNVHGVLAPIYFFSFIFVVFFVLLNMFLAIINDTYSDVKVELAVAPEEIQMSQFIKRGFFRFLKTCGCGGFVPETAQTRNEYIITVEEIRGGLKRSGFTDVEIRIFFNRYRIDPSGEEGESNIHTLLAELEDSSLKSSTDDFQSAGLVTIDDYLTQEEKLLEIHNTIITITEKVDILLKQLDTIASVRKSHTSRS